MLKQNQISHINDDTKLVRFLNMNGAGKSVGLRNHGDIECTFHYGLLHDYQIIETNAGDAKEGSTVINLGNGIIGSDTTANNALVSCWSIWDEKNNPWISLRESSFANDPDNICVIVSTVGKVRSIVQQTIEINQLLLGENFPSIVLHHTDGAIIYYPRDSGVSHKYWKEVTDTKYGIQARTTHNIFHKRDNDGKGKNYSAEREYRYALILGGGRSFFGSNKNIVLNAQDAILRDYPLTLRDGTHYIEKVYLRVPHPIIEATCYFSGIEFVKQYEKIAV
jgi:hypothetical protein